MRKEQISLESLEAYRSRTFHLLPSLRIGTEKKALDFIREAGFLLLWVSKEQLSLPSLSGAYSPGGEDWGWWEWKQTLPEKKACFYAKILRRKGTFISWEMFPCFYAVYGSRASHAEEWRAGLLDRAQKRVLDILEHEGPLMMKELRLAFGPPSKDNTRKVKRALEELQKVFRVCSSGGDTEGWSHHRWDLVERWVPARFLRKGRSMEAEKAGAAIITRYLRTTGAADLAEICWLFSWSRQTAEEFLQSVPGLMKIEIAGMKGEFLALRRVLERMKAEGLSAEGAKAE
jgi:hypothetical protein